MIHHQVDCEKCGSLMAELMDKESTNLRSAKEVAMDHFMQCRHKTTVDLVDSRMDSNNCPIIWTVSLASPSPIEEGKKFMRIEVQFMMLFRQEVPRYGLQRKRIEMQSEERFRSKILNTWIELGEKLLSDVPPDVPEEITRHLKRKKE